LVAAKVRLVGERLTTGTPAPVPETETVCCELERLSAMVSEAVAAPTAVGVKVTEMAQEALAASELPQVLDWAKTEAFVPVKEKPLMDKAAVPVFLRAMVCVAEVAPTLVELKVRLVGERLTAGTPTPVPMTETDCGEADALSATLSEAETAPTAVGLKVTEMAQEALAASELPQVLDWAKTEAFVPVKETPLMDKAAVPVFLSVMVCAAAVEPTLVAAKVRVVGERLTAGTPTPVPVRMRVCGVLGALSLKLSVAVKVPAAVGLKVKVVRQDAPGASDPAHELAPWKNVA
jgi:guanyl-specific ribonuclease Sa